MLWQKAFMENKNKVEAVLFAAGDKIEESEIARLTRIKENEVHSLLEQLKQEYLEGDKPFLIMDEGKKWKFTVKEQFMPIVQNIVPHTELNKAVMETLAVIAWKAPVLQSDIVQTRSNKAYDHIKELEEIGFVTKIRHGRSYLLKLAQRFYEYFDLKGKEDIEELFKDYKDLSETDVILEELEREGIDETPAEIQETLDSVSAGKQDAGDAPEETSSEPKEQEADEPKEVMIGGDPALIEQHMPGVVKDNLKKRLFDAE